MIITIAGELGSGKSTTGKKLAEKLNFKFFSTGDLMGDIADSKGMSLLELSKLAEKSDEVDKLLDAKQVEFGKTQKNAIIDSRLGWYFIPQAIKIFLTVEPMEAARRIYQDNRSDEKENISLETTRENILIRKKSERKRYLEYYGLEYDKKENFDLIVDTTNINPDKVVEKILKFIEEKNNKRII